MIAFQSAASHEVGDRFATASIRGNTEATLKLLKRLLSNQPVEPESTIADGLASYGAALDFLKPRHLHVLDNLSSRYRLIV